MGWNLCDSDQSWEIHEVGVRKIGMNGVIYGYNCGDTWLIVPDLRPKVV